MVRVPLRAVAAIIPAFILGVLVMLGGSALLGVYTNNAAYPAYMETLDLSEGSTGSAPTPDTPQAKSVADMESMGTFYIIGAVAWDHPLPPAAIGTMRWRSNRMSWAATPILLSWPVSTGTRRSAWRPAAAACPSAGGSPWRNRTRTGYWTAPTTWTLRTATPACRGDFGLVMTEGEFHAQHPGFDVIQNASIIITLLLWMAFMIFFTKKGWF